MLEPPRILMLSVHTSPMAALGGKKTGGMNVYVKNVAQEMARRGIHVDVVTRAASDEQVGAVLEPVPNARVIYLPCGPADFLPPDLIYLHLNEFRDALLDFSAQNRLKYDAIYSHYWLSGWVAVQLRRKWGTPVAQMFHTLGRMKQRIADRPTPEVEARIRGETEIMAHADRIIAATPAERSQMLMLYRADRRKIDIVPPGVDVKHFSPGDMQTSRQAVGWSLDNYHLLFVGRIEPLKRVDNIFEALVDLREREPDLSRQTCVSIIGGDPESDNTDEEMGRLQLMRQTLGLEGQVQFVRAQEQDVLPDYYRAAEALIMPSDYESFGMVALEAMASGTPVIATEVGGLAFLVQDGITGFHVPVREPSALANSIVRILSEPEQRAQMSVAAHKLAQDYSWTRITDRLLMVFTMLGMRPHILDLR
jgi:D-inositol-3-phosphate glycosyltransferase